MLTTAQTVTELHQSVDTLDKSTKAAAYTSALSNAHKLSTMEPLPTALVLFWSANILRVECSFRLSSYGHKVGKLPRNKQNYTANCNHISDNKFYRVLYSDKKSDFIILFGQELDKKESIIHIITDKSRLYDPFPSRSQPRRLLEEYQNSGQRNENDKTTVENKVEIADSLNIINLSDSEKPANQPPYVNDILRDLMNDQFYRYIYYFSAYYINDTKKLEILFREYPKDLFTNTINKEKNNSIFLIIIKDIDQILSNSQNRKESLLTRKIITIKLH